MRPDEFIECLTSAYRDARRKNKAGLAEYISSILLSEGIRIDDEEFETKHPRDENGKFSTSGASGRPSGTNFSAAVLEAASSADNHIEFWMSLPEDEQRKFKSQAEIKDLYERAKKNAPEQPEYKAATGTSDDFPKSIKVPKSVPHFKVVNRPEKSFSAEAGTTGEITINTANMGVDECESIIAHEAAHQLSNEDPTLQGAIIQNFGNTLGRYNQRKGHFEGIYGEYNPEEAFATGFSNYINHPESMRLKYPDAYKLYDRMTREQPEITRYIRDTVKAAQNAMRRMST